MNAEQIFAAEVFNAEKTAAEARKHGIRNTASDVIGGALGALWQYDASRADEIAKRYVYWDANDYPQRRTDIDWGNVVALSVRI
jgi:hypothetical protein